MRIPSFVSLQGIDRESLGVMVSLESKLAKEIPMACWLSRQKLMKSVATMDFIFIALMSNY